jgi:hypothetical protein
MHIYIYKDIINNILKILYFNRIEEYQNEQKNKNKLGKIERDAVFIRLI